METKYVIKDSEREKIEDYYNNLLIKWTAFSIILSSIFWCIRIPDLYKLMFDSLLGFLISMGMILLYSACIIFVFVYPLWRVKKERAIQQLEEKQKERRKRSRSKMLHKHRSI